MTQSCIEKFLVALICALALVPAAALGAPTKANPKCTPNPLFEPFPKSYMEICERARFASLDLRRWKNVEKRSGVERFKMEGEYWYYIDRIEKSDAGPVSVLEVQRNFENAIKAANGRVIYTNPDSSVEYQITRKDGEWWGVAQCGSSNGTNCGAIMHKMIRVAAMEQSVIVSSEQIAKAMGAEGKVVFYGIYFDTDKATLKTESAPTLVEMANWLKANASSKVFIVGHTDMQGSVEHNQKLSRDRAAAVVVALTKEHGIKADRLVAEGVGPLSPVAGNADEAGREKNRRVEMVLR
jgi:outer membrane protein OmpA-like peptidoglycan-associated protein